MCSYELWHYVVLQVDINVSEKIAGSIYSVSK
jgi:hypothetical protein